MGHREDLLAGAKRCLLEKGYARTTARDVVAVSGTNLGSIGYHYGSMQALMLAAMLSAMEDWGDTIGGALAAAAVGPEPDPLLRYWRATLATIDTHRDLWMASVEAMVQSDHSPELRAQLAQGIENGRWGLTALLTRTPEDELEPEAVRGLGSVQMAMMSGVIIQWLVDPARAPSPEQVVAGLRALAAIEI
jgi:AcrR family transcriptional regulator